MCLDLLVSLLLLKVKDHLDATCGIKSLVDLAVFLSLGGLGGFFFCESCLVLSLPVSLLTIVKKGPKLWLDSLCRWTFLGCLGIDSQLDVLLDELSEYIFMSDVQLVVLKDLDEVRYIKLEEELPVLTHFLDVFKLLDEKVGTSSHKDLILVFNRIMVHVADVSVIEEALNVELGQFTEKLVTLESIGLRVQSVVVALVDFVLDGGNALVVVQVLQNAADLVVGVNLTFLVERSWDLDNVEGAWSIVREDVKHVTTSSSDDGAMALVLCVGSWMSDRNV